jgi:hypothetical protein
MSDVRAEQIVGPNGEQKYMSSQRMPRSVGTYVLLAILVILLIFPVITIPILFWQYSKQRKADTVTNANTVTV